MEKRGLRRRITAWVVAGGILFSPLSDVLADKPKQGTFFQNVDENFEENKIFTYYVVKKGDYLSKICRNICVYFGQPISDDWWPSLAFQNGYPRVIQPGETIRFYTDFERNLELDKQLRNVGWTRRYIQENDVYGTRKRKHITIETVGELLYELYGDDVCIDEDFIRTFLGETKLDQKYELSEDDAYDDEMFADFTMYIPTLEQLDQYRQENNQYVKKIQNNY